MLAKFIKPPGALGVPVKTCKAQALRKTQYAFGMRRRREQAGFPPKRDGSVENAAPTKHNAPPDADRKPADRAGQIASCLL
jgi:hypothetical protein